jgi:hypothetical protein
MWFSDAIIKQGKANALIRGWQVGLGGSRADDILPCHLLDGKTEALRVSQWLSWVSIPRLLPGMVAGLSRHQPARFLSLGGQWESHLLGSTVHVFTHLAAAALHFPDESLPRRKEW